MPIESAQVGWLSNSRPSYLLPLSQLSAAALFVQRKSAVANSRRRLRLRLEADDRCIRSRSGLPLCGCSRVGPAAGSVRVYGLLQAGTSPSWGSWPAHHVEQSGHKPGESALREPQDCADESLSPCMSVRTAGRPRSWRGFHPSHNPHFFFPIPLSIFLSRFFFSFPFSSSAGSGRAFGKMPIVSGPLTPIERPKSRDDSVQ